MQQVLQEITTPANVIHQTFPLIVRKLEKKNYLKHGIDNYQLIWMEEGVKSISLGVSAMECYSNTILFNSPRMQPRLQFLCGIIPKGWIIEFPASYFRDQFLEGFNIRNIDLFYNGKDIPLIVLSPKIGQRINSIAEMIAEILQTQIPHREVAAASLLKTILVYCDSNCNIRINGTSNNHHVNLVSLFKHYISKNYSHKHHVAEYADMMHITPKYLNQVVKSVLGVTAKNLIQEQLIMHACRDLKFSNETVKEIALKLGFAEPEHFSNFFKKSMGSSPLEYRHR
jgi:AraC family transcriptional regulator, transcriptional activator of pobA